jgi:hypothetical protein
VLVALLQVVPAEMQVRLTNKESAHDTWEVIHKIHVGVDRVKEANAERLRQVFTEIKFKPNEGVEDFRLLITALANELRVLGDEVTDKEVVKRMLHSMLEKLEQVAISMEMLLDLDSLLIEEAADHLRAVEKASASGSGSSNGGCGRGHGHDKEKGCGGGRTGGTPNSNLSTGGGGVTHATTVAKRATGCTSVAPRRRWSLIRPKTMSLHYCWRRLVRSKSQQSHRCR